MEVKRVNELGKRLQTLGESVRLSQAKFALEMSSNQSMQKNRRYKQVFIKQLSGTAVHHPLCLFLYHLISCDNILTDP